MNVLDLFSGIGAFSLGLERAGMQTVAFCEIDTFDRRVLKKHWPNVPCYPDVRALTGDRLRADGIAVDLICGGFPCQDISLAGNGAGIEGSRSGLWSEYARLIRELRPRYVIVENVAALLCRGLDVVLGDLAALGYDAEWHCIPAAAVGAPHLRDRVWIVAYAVSGRRRARQHDLHGGQPDAEGRRSTMAHAARSSRKVSTSARQDLSIPGGRGGDFSDTDGVGRKGRAQNPGSTRRRSSESEEAGEWRAAGDGKTAGHRVRLAGRARLSIGPGSLREWASAAATGTGWWAAEPDVGRVVDGPAARLDRRKRLTGLGNALVPQIPEMIGRDIMRYEAAA